MRVAAVMVLSATGLALAGPEFVIGRVDTIGWTTYDWQSGGPAYRMLANAPEYGLHAGWIFSASASGTTFPDRNMRYNFYNYETGSWSGDGINVFTERSGFGSLDCDPTSKVALVSAHAGYPPGIRVARDMAPGAGVFEYCQGPEGYYEPKIAVDGNRWVHVAANDDSTREQLWFCRCTTWCNWSAPVHIPPPEPDPGFPSHNIAASKVSTEVALAWVGTTTERHPAYHSVSTDGGATWPPPTQLLWPPAFSGDTLPAFHLGLFPHYDRQDRLHVVAEVLPVVNETAYTMPCELWHWCPDNNPQWTRIHRANANPSSIPVPIGYNAALAGRSSIGEDRTGGLYVAWEQFDTLNYEPLTERLRADIWYARDNNDNGRSWQAGVRITDPDENSKRFPCVVDLLARDTLCIVYMIDQVAGFFVHSEGPATNNPVVAHFVPVTVGGLENRPGSARSAPGFDVCPNPFSASTRLRFCLAEPGRAKLELFSNSGQRVALLVDRRLDAGGYSFRWRPAGFASGVYVARLDVNGRATSRRLVLSR